MEKILLVLRRRCRERIATKPINDVTNPMFTFLLRQMASSWLLHLRMCPPIAPTVFDMKVNGLWLPRIKIAAMILRHHYQKSILHTLADIRSPCVDVASKGILTACREEKRYPWASSIWGLTPRRTHNLSFHPLSQTPNLN